MLVVLTVLAIVLFVWITWLAPSARRKGPAARRSPSREQAHQALDLSDPAGECDFHIVGESNYQPELRRVAKSGRTFLAVVMREPTNPADPNAIRVLAEGGKTVGYMSRDYAAEYQNVFRLLEKHGRVGACRAKLIGGVGHKKSFGVMINIKDTETILVDVRDTLEPGQAVAADVQPF
jgi:hypothetical protein